MTTDPDQLRIFLNRVDEVGASYRFLPLDMSGRKSKPPSWKAKDGGILESAVINRDEAIAHLEGGMNLAVLCMDEGPDSLIIIDPDIANIPETQREGYITRIEAVIDECDCFTVRTPSGGWHIYCVNDSRAYNGGFVHPDYGDITVIDVQSDRVYAVSPGSWLRRTEIKDGAIKGMPPVYHVVRDAPIRSGSLVFTSLENHGFKFVESAKKDKNTELRKMIILRNQTGNIADDWDLPGVEYWLMPLNPIRNSGGIIQGSHPIHGSTGGQNLLIDTNKQLWQCFRKGCQSGGDRTLAAAVSLGVIQCHEARKGALDDPEVCGRLFKALEDAGYRRNDEAKAAELAAGLISSYENRAEDEPGTKDETPPTRIKAVDTRRKMPDLIKTIPGILGEHARYTDTINRMRQPQFSVQSALALGSVVCGRRYVTSRDNRSSLFLMNVGDTSSGKKAALDSISTALYSAGANHLLITDAYQSAEGLSRELLDRIVHIATINEAPVKLGLVNNPNSSHARSMLNRWLEVWDCPLQYDMPKRSSATRQRVDEPDKIFRPCLTLLLAGTPDQLFKMANADFISSGFFPRILASFADDTAPVKNPDWRSREPYPTEVTRWIKEELGPLMVGGEMTDAIIPGLSTEIPDETVIPFTEDAEIALDTFGDEITEIAYQSDEPLVRALLGKAQEIAQRVSLIITRSCRSKIIDTFHVRWAVEYVRYHSLVFCDQIGISLAEGPNQRRVLAVLQTLKRAVDEDGYPRELTANELRRYTRHLRDCKPSERDDVLAMLVEDHGHEISVREWTAANGRRVLSYRYTGGCNQ